MSLNLTAAGLADQKAWEAAGYALPSYDREAMITRTKESPCWVHFGAGNIFRAFQANTAQELLNNGTFDRGVIVAEGFDTEIIRDMYQPHDNLSILVTLKADGSVEKTIVGSIAESLAADTADSPDFARLKEIFTKDSLQMATFTITEKGYSLKNGAGELLPSVAADLPDLLPLPAIWEKLLLFYMKDFLQAKNRLRWSAPTTAPTMAKNFPLP